ncbi:hypothetical protein EJ04DRAFT_513869, partial [Polyplosphaeria fusca]
MPQLQREIGNPSHVTLRQSILTFSVALCSFQSLFWCDLETSILLFLLPCLGPGFVSMYNIFTVHMPYFVI